MPSPFGQIHTRLDFRRPHLLFQLIPAQFGPLYSFAEAGSDFTRERPFALQLSRRNGGSTHFTYTDDEAVVNDIESASRPLSLNCADLVWPSGPLDWSIRTVGLSCGPSGILNNSTTSSRHVYPARVKGQSQISRR